MKKQLTQKAKIKRAVKLFDKIKELLPNNAVSMMMHSVHPDDLPKEFTVKYKGVNSFERNNNTFDVTIFVDAVNNHE
jgi:hypothetical protein